MWLIQRFIYDPHWIRNARPARLDVIGFSFMSLWLGCQEVLLDKGQEDDWFGSHFIILMAVLAVIGLVVFVRARTFGGKTVCGPARVEELQLQPRLGADVLCRRDAIQPDGHHPACSCKR